jgi:hypothetical protein
LRIELSFEILVQRAGPARHQQGSEQVGGESGIPDRNWDTWLARDLPTQYNAIGNEICMTASVKSTSSVQKGSSNEPASASGVFHIGGELPVHRLGFIGSG